MLTIGELAELAGTTTRTVRHYHAVGLLPEPARRSNGYRTFDASDAVRLVRIRRLVSLGLSLAEVADALRDDERELRDVLGELDAELARQERAVRERRRRVADLLARDSDLSASQQVARVMADLRRVAPGEDAAVQRERELLELLEAAGVEQVGTIISQYLLALRDPAVVEAGLELYHHRFEALAALDPADPQVMRLAKQFTQLGARLPGLAPAAAGMGVETPAAETLAAAESVAAAEGDAVWASYLATVAPAQRRCLELAWAQGLQ